MKQVLISPSSYSLSNERYGKAYNILNNLSSEDFKIEACVASTEGASLPENVHTTSLGGSRKPTYYFNAFRYANQKLRAGEVDLYHHMNLNFRWFNPLLSLKQPPDVPILIGPAQAAHEIPMDEIRMKTQGVLPEWFPRQFATVAEKAALAAKRLSIPPRELFFKRTLDAADRVIVVNEETRDIYAKYVDREKIEVIPIGVDTEYFSYSEDRDRYNLVTVGRLTERKGYFDLLESMAGIVRDFPEVTLDIFGGGPLRKDLEEKVHDLGLEDVITFHGKVDQDVVRGYLQSAGLFVHPSHSESFSPVRLEAMSTGCPIVATDVIGADEMIRDGVDGFVVPTESPAELRDAMIQILGNKLLATEMGKSARSRVESSYSWETVGESYLEVYSTLLFER
ncbi:glycosyltransferase family 4 protein [Halorubrum aidingense]|uniref:glycosyltransferase family 4 protein n=1 Tax=Halorubrum aidingense TaxID=368623 RepID=UPI0009B5C942|nr:glycosyltransferase family 4 protein [Halorubrum aidingense]